MVKIEFPQHIQNLFRDSDLEAPIRLLADRVGEILADNQLEFFPNYTDHGIDHVNRVIKTELELVPRHVWDNSRRDSSPRLLCDADAAVIMGSTLLHDIAMHLRPHGFLELIDSNSRFQPLPWFAEGHDDHSADRPWYVLWEDYVREARRFSDRELLNVTGESGGSYKFSDLPKNVQEWNLNHRLIIGEFIRRHHARLAHEIAIYGFPGLPVGSGEGHFPAMGMEEGHALMRLADLIGLTARSHGISLRVCKAYLDSSPRYVGTPRPMNSAVLYPMALLRVADYLQIDRQRAPAVLLNLRSPQSPISVQEWKKHLAVQQIGPATDPRGKMVTVNTDISLSLYLQISELLAGVQAEMDHSTAVLDEAYGVRFDIGLNQLNLSIRRVYSNLNSSAFRDSLPYVPTRTGFTADPNLLTLLIEPLYGKQPGVGVRELMQNAVDAVNELQAWSSAHGKPADSLALPEQDGDVLVEFVERQTGSWYLRVRDKGIGMTHETIQNYFLRAGASFRSSKEWAKEFLDEEGRPLVARAGRFGIGAFAVFLLGPSFRLWTRRASIKRSMGYMIEASSNSQLIEIRREDSLPIGTTIEVDLSSDTVEAFNLEGKEGGFGLFKIMTKPQVDWYCWDWPRVEKRIVRWSEIETLPQKYSCPVRSKKLPPELNVIFPNRYDAVYWGFGDMPKLSCNGLRIMAPTRREADFDWPQDIQLQSPCVAVVDSGANLPLTTQRYALSQDALPFLNDLARDVTLSFIAHALVCGPTSRSEAFALRAEHPLKPKHQSVSRYREGDFSLCLTDPTLDWCVTSTEIIPADPWLYSLLNTSKCMVFGILSSNKATLNRFLTHKLPFLSEKIVQPDCAIFSQFGTLDHEKDNDKIFEDPEYISNLSMHMFTESASEGIKRLGHEVNGCKIGVSTCTEFTLETDEQIVWEELTRDPDGFDETLFGKKPYSLRTWFEGKTGSSLSRRSTKNLLKSMEAAFDDKSRSRHRRKLTLPEFLYVLEFSTKKVVRRPESLIANIWEECIGARAIPFDPAARKALIADGCKHNELKRHIESWEEMKKSGSKWLNGPN